ncbi:UPF0057-domain-containing protein [Pseudovirgaria hyperparasitica]|uniref:UPF0057-domain-containing protein n=1 Tax=Pseudovirgaria hyperparasitica TaxID=470096 RepID=A0A6A6VY36_9PEZI|nr:UPF0057-domain-containing protein [Pseudovirgaria hyperparasitica]KAF2754614.1 UPF0057-domain-containing protein [Pseudovirgaria hyperparasitica]
MCGTDIFLAILSVVFPPIGVWVKRGICSADSLINIALCVLGFLPGLLHAWYIIVSYPDEYEQAPQDAEGGSGTVTYYYVQGGSAPRHHHQQQRPAQGGYGTVNSQPSQQFPGQQAGAYYPKNQAHAPQAQQGPGPVDGPSNGGAALPPPPSYADAVKGDNKIQTNDQ